MNRSPLLLTFLLFFGTTIIQAQPLAPVDVSQFAVTPNTESTLQWKASEPIPAEKLVFTIFDAYGEAITTKGTATLAGDTVSATVALPQGYWEIAFDALDGRFGIVSLPAAESRDTFFAIDGAMSWLVKGNDLREGMIKLCKRTGIGMVRERLRFASVAYEEGKFNWSGSGHYDQLRETYNKHGIEVLEMFHDAPAWMGRVGSYPKNIVQFADAADKLTERWEHTWGGFELWNEPDIFFSGDLPADQYLPLVKAYVYRANERGGKTPIIGGALAYLNPEWLANAKANNLLDLIDIFSFHTYDRAPNMENLIETCRNYVAQDKVHENMPLWLTECGRAWRKGPNRPPVEQDFESAIDIVMKGVESKCCGIDRYFAFVLPYYEEHIYNFGMLGKQGTPLRAFGGYAQMIHALAHKDYIGDLKSGAFTVENVENSPLVLRARVFQNPIGGPCVVVLYTGKTNPTNIQAAFSVQKAETVTGELCKPSEIRGLVYLYADAIPDTMIDKETNAMRLLAYTKMPYIPRRREGRGLSPVIPVYQRDEKQMKSNSTGYRLGPNLEESPISFQLFNLSDTPQSGSFGLNDFVLEPYQSKKILTTDAVRPVDGKAFFHYDYAIEDAGGGCVQLCFLGNPTLEGLRKLHPDAVKVPLSRSPGISGNGTLEIDTIGDGGVRMSATFGEGDKWCYPRTTLPENVKLKETGGIFAKIRYTGQGTLPRIFLYEEDGTGFLSDDLFLVPYDGLKEAEGQWDVIVIPFSAFKYNGSTPPNPDGKLDFNQISEFSFGFNTTAEKATLEIEEVWIYEE